MEARQTSGGNEASQPWVITAVLNQGPKCSIEGYPRIVSAAGQASPRGAPELVPISVHDGADFEHPDPGPHHLVLAHGGGASLALGTGTAYCGGSPLYLVSSLSVRLPNGGPASLTVPVQTDASACPGTPIIFDVTAFVKGSGGPPTG